MSGARARRRVLPVVRARRRGFSLVELMIALVLGLIVVAAAYNMYTGSTRSARFTAGLQSVQENGRHGVVMLRRGFGLAGYAPPSGGLVPLDIEASGPERVVVRLRSAYDCNGQSTDDVDGVAVNTYAFDEAGGQITCTGNSASATAMPIVENVEAFRLLYGIDESDDEIDDADNGLPERFVTHDVVPDAASVTALRFAMLVSSGDPVRTHARPRTHVVLDEELVRDDRLARAVFGATVMLRNSERLLGRSSP